MDDGGTVRDDEPAASKRPLGRMLLVGATIAVLAASGVGLAVADVSSSSAQDTGHTKTNNAHVPPGHDRYNDPVVCPGGPYRNHGAYVRSHKNDPNAGKSPCGKPVRSVHPPGSGKSKDDAKDDDKSGAKKSHVEKHKDKGAHAS